MLLRRVFFFSTLFLVSLAADPDECQTIEEIVRSHGFNLEHHNVTTKDGYILTVHRLVDMKEEVEFAGGVDNEERWYYETDEPVKPKKKAVILQHGLLGSSADFFISSPFLYSQLDANYSSKFSGESHKTGDNLGFALHLTERYDVWLGNSRGNRYSQGHVKYDSKKDHAYWRFSFDQMAEYDNPAVIDYVLNATQSTSVGYVGFSQGTASIFALLSLKPAYAEKIKPVVAMAPIYTVADIKSPIRYLSSLSPLLRAIGGEFAPSEPAVNWVSKILCRNYVEERFLCENIVFLFSGFDATHLNISRTPVYFTFLPSTVSTWEIAHWAQLVSSRRFARFDYGSEKENLAVYGYPHPPDFNVLRIPANTTIALMRATNDYLSSVPDQERLIGMLKRAHVNVIDYVVPDRKWTHIDFAVGVGAGHLVYDKVIEVLDKYAQ